MALDFEDLYSIVEESSSYTAFNKEECIVLATLLLSLNDNASIVEIGVEYGRSTTVIAEISKQKNFNFTAIDSYLHDDSVQALKHLKKQIEKHNWNFDLKVDSSLSVLSTWNKSIDLIHIDGDHDYNGVLADLEWLKFVKVGGYVVFDDYGHKSLEGVFNAVQDHLDKSIFKELGVFSSKFGVFKRCQV